MNIAGDHRADQSTLIRAIHVMLSLLIGTCLCLTAPTSLIVLGWLMRRMRFLAMRRSGLAVEPPGWMFGAGTGLERVFSGLAANIREGVMAAFSMALGTFPFSVIWLLSWWAGWENSFSKGYEQAFVGPMLGLVGVGIFCVLMVWLPLALAHQAVENRALALFEWRKVRSAVRHTGWGYFLFAAFAVFLALPLFAGRGLVTFASGIVPGFDQMTTEQAASLAGIIDITLAAYIFVSLFILRSWSAGIYVAAVTRARAGVDAELWHLSPLGNGAPVGRRSWKLTHWARLAAIAVVWFGLAAQIFVAQFLNHDWHLWVTHPFLVLPWAG